MRRNMKKIFTIATILGLVGILSSCNKDYNNPETPGENTIRVELFCADPATKAAAEPVDGIGNENEPVVELWEDRPRTGNSMELTDKALVIELRHPDQKEENERFDQVEVKLREWLLHILSL